MARVILLGTGDPINDERAQASLAVPLDHGEWLLVDTSSGTVLLRQLAAAAIPLARIRHIVVTHRHFDHAGGLAPLLVAMIGEAGARVTVHAPPETLAALHALLEVTIPGVEEWLGARLTWRTLEPEAMVPVGSARVTPFAVAHGMECVGLRIEQGGTSIVFSADTRPCERLVTYARGADVLIHEAYGLHDGAERAHVYGHATARDAGEAARAARARRLVLTHFRSSAFVDVAALGDEAAAAYGAAVELARDLDVLEVAAALDEAAS